MLIFATADFCYGVPLTVVSQEVFSDFVRAQSTWAASAHLQLERVQRRATSTAMTLQVLDQCSVYA
jgi:hypothetical protein